jgi:ABC-type transporter Mla subunit MlaD
MSKKIVMLLALCLAFLGCKEEGTHLKIKYAQIQGLEKENRVLFEQNQIGRVAEVSYEKGGYYLVDVVIANDFAKSLTEHSRFFIIADKGNTGKMAIEMTLDREGGAVLIDGATVEGSTKQSAFIDQMLGDFEKGLEDLKKKFDKFTDDLGKIPESDEFKRLEKELKRITEELKRSGRAAGEKIQKEVLPRLEKELEKLKEKLQKFRKKEEVKPLEV